MKILKMVVVLGLIAGGGAIANHYGVIHSVVGRITEEIDERSSVDTLMRRLEAALRADQEKLGKAIGNFRQLENQLAGLLMQREHYCQQLQQTRAVTQYIVAQLDKPGETIEIHDDMSRSRTDVEKDLATYMARGNEQEAELQRLGERIATLHSYRERAGECIAAAQQQLREDEERLGRLKLKQALIFVVEPIRPLVKNKAPSVNGSPQREYDHVAELVQTRFQEIPQPAPVTETPWRELVVQNKPADDPAAQSELPTADRVARK